MTLSLASLGAAVPYPNRLERNPKRKNKQFIAQWGRAFVSEALSQADYPHWYHAAGENEKRVKYALGQQDPATYERFATAATDVTDPTGISRRIDRRILPIVPKHLRILSDKLAETQFEPSVAVIDPEAEQEEDDHMNTIRLWQQQGEFLKSKGIAPPKELPSELPEGEDELNIYRDGTYVQEAAVQMELKLALALAEADYVQIDREVVLDFFTMGESAQFVAMQNERPVPLRLLPGRCLFLKSAYENYRDMRAGAHLDYLTLGQLKAEAGDHLKEEDYKLICESALTKGGKPFAEMDSGLGTATDSAMVTVIRFSFLSEDDMVWNTRTNQFGNEVTKRKSADYQNPDGKGKTTRKTAVNVYEGNLIVGTDLHYNCRLAVHQMRDMKNPLRGLLPYIAVTPGMLAGRSSVPMDETMSIADFCQDQWLRLQDACLRAVPQGYNFDPEVLMESLLMLKGKDVSADGKLDLKPTIEMFYRTGNSTTKRKGRGGEMLPPGITKNDTGVPTDVAQYWQNLRSGLQMLESIMGSNAVVSAATPSPEMGKGVADLAVAGTISSMGYLAHGKRMMFDGVCRAVATRIWQNEKRAPLTGSVQMGPGQAPKRVKAQPGLSKRRFDVRIELKPNKDLWDQFYGVVQRSLDNKEITAGDFAALMQVDNLKQARYLLSNRAKRNEKMKQKLQQENMQANFEGEATTAERVEAAKQKTLEVEHGLVMQREALITDRSVQVANIYASAQNKNEEVRGAARLQDTQLQQQATAEREALADVRAATMEAAQPIEPQLA